MSDPRWLSCCVSLDDVLSSFGSSSPVPAALFIPRRSAAPVHLSPTPSTALSLQRPIAATEPLDNFGAFAPASAACLRTRRFDSFPRQHTAHGCRNAADCHCRRHRCTSMQYRPSAPIHRVQLIQLFQSSAFDRLNASMRDELLTLRACTESRNSVAIKRMDRI